MRRLEMNGDKGDEAWYVSGRKHIRKNEARTGPASLGRDHRRIQSVRCKVRTYKRAEFVMCLVGGHFYGVLPGGVERVEGAKGAWCLWIWGPGKSL